MVCVCMLSFTSCVKVAIHVADVFGRCEGHCMLLWSQKIIEDILGVFHSEELQKQLDAFRSLMPHLPPKITASLVKRAREFRTTSEHSRAGAKRTVSV